MKLTRYRYQPLAIRSRACPARVPFGFARDGAATDVHRVAMNPRIRVWIFLDEIDSATDGCGNSQMALEVVFLINFIFKIFRLRIYPGLKTMLHLNHDARNKLPDLTRTPGGEL
jgi:hypothetical protein